MPERYAASWNAWQPSFRTYAGSYTRPERWSLTLNGCGSSGAGEKIVSYEWTIRGVTVDGFKAHRSGAVCNLTLNNVLPARGQYEVTLLVKTTSGASDSSTQPIEIKDWLIVSIGDSFSSGEGNPDRPGVYGADPIQGCQGKITHVEKRAVWKDRRCHRSALSVPALTAEQIERSDDQSSVTFLSFACSGAKIEHLISEWYRGQEPPAQPYALVLPQIAAVKAAVGDRPIDALLVTVGINDLDFSSLMTDCAAPQHGLIERLWATADDPCIGSGLIKRTEKLKKQYKLLANAIKRELLVKEVYIAEYPTNVLADKSGLLHVCECLNVASHGVNDNEFNYLGFGGRRLNANIALAAREEGWNYINGATDQFQGRGYCASSDQRFFVQVVESVKRQGPVHGGLHPNASGHQAVSDLMMSAIQLGTNTRPHKRVTVTFDRVKVGKVDNGSQRFLEVRFSIRQRLKQPFQDFLSNVPPLYEARFSDDDLPNGRWVDLPAGKFSLTFDVFRSPNPPRYVTDFDIYIVGNGINRHRTSLASLENFGEGTHIEVTPEPPHDQFGIEYTISVRNLAPFDPVSPPLAPGDAGGGTVK